MAHIYIPRLVFALLTPSACQPRNPLVRRGRSLPDAATCLDFILFIFYFFAAATVESRRAFVGKELFP